MVTHGELRELGFSDEAIKHRVGTRRLHPMARGVYAVGSPNLTQHGRWMVAVKACGEGAALSHLSAAVLWGVWRREPPEIHVSVPYSANPQHGGIRVHRRKAYETTRFAGIPVTTPECTLIDVTAICERDDVEHMINEADVKRRTNVAKLRQAVDRVGRRPGATGLQRIVDIATFRFTRSALERRFIPIALSAGLSRPLTAQVVNGYEVDFFWPDLKLVVETDGLTFHRTPQKQADDLRRDQRHVAAGLTVLRFSHGQIRYEPERVERVLAEVASRVAA